MRCRPFGFAEQLVTQSNGGENQRDTNDSGSSEGDPSNPEDADESASANSGDERGTIAAELIRIREQVEIRGREIDILQIELGRRSRRWFQEPGALISIVAVVVSVLATLLGQLSTSTDRQIQERTRLTTVLQQLADDQQKRDAVTLQYGSAQAYLNVNDLDKALTIASQADQQASSISDRTSAGRAIASILFNQGKYDEGRQTFQQTENVVVDEKSALAALVRSQNIFEIEMLWTGLELGTNHCSEAKNHLSTMERIVETYPSAGVAEQLKVQLATRAKQASMLCK